MGKRKYQPDEKLDVFTERLKKLHAELVDDGGNTLAGLAILHLAQEAGMTIAELQKLMASPGPSFSDAKWETVAPALGLRADLGVEQPEPFTVPIDILPPSFHRELMKNISRWMDVYQESPSRRREESRVHLLEAVCMPNILRVHI